MGKTAFVYSGGGAKGCIEVGATQRLFETGIIPDVCYGTSTGALQAMGVAYLGIEELTNKWLAIKGKSDILKRNWLFPFFCEGVYSTSPLKKHLQEIITKSKIIPACEAVTCTVNLKSGAVQYTSNYTVSPQEYCDATLASASIPVIMDTVNGMVDGGVREQTPLKRAIDDGCDRIYVMLCNPVVSNPVDTWKVPTGIIKFYSILNRAIDLFEHEVFLNDIEDCIQHNTRSDAKKIDLHVFAPDRVLMDTIDFNPAKIREGIALGRSLL